jgi:dethiobiotin synthetase
MKQYFVTGTGTEVGKTIASAILVEALKADYWKPIQAGGLLRSDTIQIKKLISNKETEFHHEAYSLTKPMSPHAAALLDMVKIELPEIKLPETDRNLIVEGVGGVMVPLNGTELVIDLIKKLDIEVVVVSQNYLGSINHTLLTCEALKSKGVKVAGIIFNGEPNKSTENYILRITGLKCILRIGQEDVINKAVIERYSKKVRL